MSDVVLRTRTSEYLVLMVSSVGRTLAQIHISRNLYAVQ